ncbi:MAG: ABC transporter ATP-binding protein [Candidatus Tectomicrobia bacterium]|nr:ABC transporter ATP-binding protein [Candidatus Tectomicrobia bacterium]
METRKQNGLLLQVKNLKTQFFTEDGVVKAVNGVSFELTPGETLGIVGESGCGKSVTALSLMRLIPQPPGEIVDGEVIFEGNNLLKANDETLRHIRGNKISMIFQDPMTSLNPVLTIGRQLSEGLQLHLKMSRREARERSAELLRIVGIPSAETRLDNYPHQFSGGMRQRVMIAMALSCNPQLLLADEPTTALDVTIQAQILDLMRKLCSDRGTAVILITHDLGVVAGMTNRVMVMYAGRVVESAPTREVFHNPKHPYTLGLLRSIPRLDEAQKEKLEVIEGFPPDLIGDIVGCPFAPRCGYVQDRCREETPLLESIGNEHRVACWVALEGGIK